MNNIEITNKECDWKDENGYVTAVPNHTYIKLRLVKSNAANGKNETIIMQANDDGKTFSIIKGDTGRRYGRRAPKKIPVVYSMEAWDDYFWDKINKDWRVKGLEETKEKTIEKRQGDFTGVDPDVKDVLEILLGAANKVIEEQYSINIEDIPDEDLKRGQEIITELSQAGENISVAEFNNMLTELWLAVPRVIRKVNKEKVFNKTEFQAKLEKEQELLDFLMAMLRGKGNTVINNGNILTQNNLIWEPVSDKEVAMLKDKMGDQRTRFLRAWRVTNTVTEKRFDEYCKSRNLTEDNGITELFHGSGTPNWWSIATNGLYLNPSGVQIHGKAFGYGLYFAPYAKKSIGYTSSYGSYWEHGDASKGYLAVFKVATGNIYDVYGEGNGRAPHNYEDFHEDHPDKDCCWAYSKSMYGNSYLCNDEVIVYREDQATIKYLIEFSA